jgi:deazaflavin-dependent oxidoreductase (nitroreductase family)
MAFALVNVAIALFERFSPPNAVRFYMKYIGNPSFRAASGTVPGFAVVEVVGRKTGRPHRVNVGGRVIGSSFWFLARRDAQYVRNMNANPSVRLRFHGRWHEGMAHLMPEDNAKRRLLTLNLFNGFFLWLVGVDLLTVRVELDHVFATASSPE